MINGSELELTLASHLQMNISEWDVHRQVRLSLIVADVPAYFKRAASYTKRYTTKSESEREGKGRELAPIKTLLCGFSVHWSQLPTGTSWAYSFEIKEIVILGIFYFFLRLAKWEQTQNKVVLLFKLCCEEVLYFEAGMDGT